VLVGTLRNTPSRTYIGRNNAREMFGESVLDYEQLVAQYQHDLLHLLRGHSSVDYLEMWVPDEDHVKSLVNMAEAAQSSELDRLVVDLGEAIAKELDRAKLLQLLGDVGTATLEPIDAGARLTISGMTMSRSGGSAYRQALNARAACIVHAGSLAAEDSTPILQATVDGVTLTVKTDTDGLVTAAAHHGAHGDICTALDVMCSIIPGLPLQEAAEHGVIRLESALRDKSGAPPMPGIMNPISADRIFVIVQHLVRELFAGYLKMSGSLRKVNTYADRPQAAWLTLPPQARLDAAETTLRKVLGARGSVDDARVLRIEHDCRVMIVFRASVPPADKARLAFAFEIALHTECDGALQVFLDDLTDENAARRL
jgi:hypothetical protein